MSRIFVTLSVVSLLLVAAALLLGLGIGDLYDAPSQETLRWRRVHLLTGTAAALAVVLVESIVVTYFIGTSRWCKEVTETYQLDPAAMNQSTRLKRRTFPLCLVGMLTVVGVGALGAASDPGTGRPNTESVAIFHLGAALAGIAIIAWTYFRSWLNIVENQTVIDKIVAAVSQIRTERGLETAAAAESAADG